jgi:hypothetical protein
MPITTHQTMRLYSQQLSYNHLYNYQADEAVNYGGMVALSVTKFHTVLTIQDRVTTLTEI